MKSRALLIAASLLMSVALPARAVPYGLLLESDANTSSGLEVFALTYDSWGDVLTNSISTQGFTPLDINSAYSMTGFTFDGTAYRLLLESNANATGGLELFQVTYNTWDDLLTNTIASQGFLPLDINSAYSSAGFTFDGTAYRLLLESNANAVGGLEVYALTYNSWADVLANNIAQQGFLPLDISSAYSIGGFTFDGDAYRMLLESNANTVGGLEVYTLSYNTWADVLANNIAQQGFTPLDINSAYSIGGFGALAFPTTEPPPQPVPEPSMFVLLMLGLGWLAAMRLRLSRFPIDLSTELRKLRAT